MPLYETTFILNPQLDEGAIDNRVKETIGIIENGGGKILKENRIGTRRLAYELKNMSQGYYVDLVFEAEGTLPTALDRHYRLGEAFLRYLTCSYEGKIGAEEKDEAAVSEATAAESSASDDRDA